MQLVLVVEVQTGGERIVHEGLDAVLDARGLLGGRAHHGDLPVGVHGVAAGHLVLLEDADGSAGLGGLVDGGQSGITRAHDEHFGLLVPVDVGTRRRGSRVGKLVFALRRAAGKAEYGERSGGGSAHKEVAAREALLGGVQLPCVVHDAHDPLLFVGSATTGRTIRAACRTAHRPDGLNRTTQKG